MIESEIKQFEQLYALIIEYLVTYSFQVIGALFILLLGIWLAQKVSKFIFRLMQKQNIDITLSTFISNVIKVLFITMVVVISLGKLGISVTPFVAAIGAASLGAGLALQGMLSNYGAGLAIIATRPFKVGDTIQVNSVCGQVKSIELGVTILCNEDNVEITIPNKHIVGEILHNSFAYSLISGEVGIAYNNSPDVAIDTISTTLNQIENIAQEPKIQVGIEAFADSSILISYRYWVPTTTLVSTKLKVNLAIFEALKNKNIEIPFPQRVITINKE
ncbi:mechanosensitive ion channel family protein [Pseudoalteromonas denitrificans]|uniref:Small-conductance mechanosensitive channel n=1 Tax=Pseudoalteromonas denitrificans DSM 6059 TaxID=1123010 RepID=A0A1I1E6D1_9GAMM|nr:mechanosensitive ion channel family protein [Pseudoalteromonas denitrificans]SFB82216.1 small conductance mechanosensitive channel [Pseudoalteromonas denitrificans DSM 6059]